MAEKPLPPTFAEELQVIHANFPDEIFSDKGIDAEKEAQTLFGNEAKKSFHSVSAWCVRILGFAFLLMVTSTALVRCWHLLAPEDWTWLSPNAVNSIDHIIIGSLAGISARFFPLATKPKE